MSTIISLLEDEEEEEEVVITPSQCVITSTSSVITSKFANISEADKDDLSRKRIQDQYDASRIINVDCEIDMEPFHYSDDVRFMDDFPLAEGVEWGEVAEEEECEARGLLTHGSLIPHGRQRILRGVDGTEPLFDGSPHSAKDFCRYLLATRHSTGLCFVIPHITAHYM
jgi:hypothetical protein